MEDDVRNVIQLVVFLIEQQSYAVHLTCVERVVPAVEITPLPKAPSVVLGVLNMSGEIIPVMNVRKRFKLPERELKLSDHFIVCRTTRRPVALVADSASSVIDCPRESIIAAEKIIPGMEYLKGVAKLPEGLILIHDLEKFLSLEEEQTMQQALAQI